MRLEKKEKVKKEQKDILRVVAYTRVSNLEKNGTHSALSQKLYYKNKIQNNKDWILVNIYSDDGISGSTIKGRDNFLRMIVDADRGKYDFIITKSISRFARNTLDTLKYVRFLKARGIGILFEEENINTLDMSSELVLTILSSVAQQEIINLSESIKHTLVAKMKRGEVSKNYECFGYRFDYDTSNLIIKNEEAEIVRLIYKLFLKQKSYVKVAKILKELKIKSRSNSQRWTSNSIKDLLCNTTYSGDIIMQKYYIPEPARHTKTNNNGYLDKYIIRNNHEPIIDKQTFEKVQEIVFEIKEKCLLSNKPIKNSEYSHFLKCGLCGSGIKPEKRNYQNDVYYSCKEPKYEANSKCYKSCYFKKEVIDNCFSKVIKMLRKLTLKNESFLYVKNYLDNNRKYDRESFVSDLIEGIFLGDDIDNYSISFVFKNNSFINNKIDIENLRNNKYLKLFDFYEYEKIVCTDEYHQTFVRDGFDVLVYLDEDY